MNRSLPRWTVISILLILAGIVAGCSSSGSGSGGSGGLTAGLFGAAGTTLEEDGFGLAADPSDVIIDTTTTPPADSGQTTLTATVLDPETDQPLEGVEVTFSTDAGMLASGGTPVLTAADGTATDTLTVALADPDSIGVSALEFFAGRTESVVVNKVVILPNQPPVADAGADFDVPCDSVDGAMVTLDGSGSTDPDSTAETHDDIVAFEWFEDFQTVDEIALGSGEVLDVTLAFGVHVITLVVTDTEGLTDSVTITVEVVDVEAPVVTLEVDPEMLWPPNHKMVDVTATLAVEDCSPTTVELISVTSSEPPNGTGDGDTEPDVAGASSGEEDYELQLRAERAGGGPGRVYTLLYRVTDAVGFVTEVAAEVVVPHDQGGM